MIYPNSGEEWDAANELWVAGTGVTKSHAMAQRLLELVQHIETKWRQCSDKSVPSILVGGCCRTVPATIAALSMLIGTHLALSSEAGHKQKDRI